MWHSAPMAARVLLLGLAILLTGCADEICDCGAGGELFVELSDVQPGGSVEVCFENQCADGPLSEVDGTADEATVPFDELGSLEEQLAAGATVQITVRDATGNDSRSDAVVPVHGENCCGVFWTAEL